MFYRKLNKKFFIDHYQKNGSKIEYGIDTPMGFRGVKYSHVRTSYDDELYRVIPSSDRENCKLSVMELNYTLPPHTNNGIESVINFYIKPDKCITQFYYPLNPEIHGDDINNQIEGATFHNSYLKKSVRFMAYPGEAYLLDLSKPYSITPTRPGITDCKCICMELPYNSFDEAVQILTSNGEIDDKNS